MDYTSPPPPAPQSSHLLHHPLQQQQHSPQPHHPTHSHYLDSLLSDFPPTPRARSNTWPCRPVEVDPSPQQPYTDQDMGPQHNPPNTTTPPPPSSLTLLQQKKSTSRRNAWGNLSYADLITQAIGSSPEKRLTLSQIYDWMVGNVGYFKDKGDSNSSAGWKVSGFTYLMNFS